MSRDIAQANNSPLISELFQASVYKPTQGRIVRQATALAIWVIVGLGAWQLNSTMKSMMTAGSYWPTVVPGLVLVSGLWFGFRLVNWPRFADFLIAVEAEMNKVSWPSKDELIRASIVVIFTIFFLATTLFLFDVLWQWFFNVLGVTS
ncbi:preprotein translocase subunit SecE [Crateriforma conspicua]|uniref:Protein translocase subunit SecE n=1 Tax=Crateriforma conspicua TaxID=2527996 RepID=A0A5C6FQN9_9PLAN|nr:preprotein translocase subunit SecE [Crateriforma conspicua]TWU62421.1 preprotein translocase subunit SecE [Crateriforma conspicua]